MNMQLSLNFDEQPMKRCPGCKQIQSLDCFHKNKRKKDGSYYCKKCRRQYSIIHKKERAKYMKQWVEKNKEKIAKYYQDHKKEHHERTKKWRQKNRKKVNELSERYRQNNKEKVAKTLKKWGQGHRKEIAEYRRRKLKEDPKFKLNCSISSAIAHSLKRRNTSKNGRPWESLVNFTLEELMTHLENQFRDGMTWENQGLWHLDHRRPISLFVFESVEDPGFKKCWALENLQPLWAKENLEKSSKYIEGQTSREVEIEAL